MDSPGHWLATALLGALALLCVGSNYSIVWRQLRAKPEEKTPSLIPILGGVLGYFALKVCPLPAAAARPWIALLVDPGCYVLYLPLIMLGRLVRR